MIRAAAGVVDHRIRKMLGMRPLPRLLTWTVTFRCNARCSMCDSWRKDAKDELDTATSLAMVRTLPKSVSMVRLTGGEPFVRKDLAILVNEIQDHLRPGFLHVTTNGFLTEEIVSFLEARASRGSSRLQLLLSLDGAKESHDRIRGRSFAFDSAMATLKAVAKSRRRWKVDLAVNQTIVDPRGIEEYGELHEALSSLEVPHHVVVAYAESATYSTSANVDVAPRHPGEFRTVVPLDPHTVDAFLRRLDQDLSRLPRSSRLAKSYYYRGLRGRLLEGKAWPNPRCEALTGHLRIFPDGSVPVCQFNSASVGNLARDGFDAVWNGEEIRRRRDWVRACPGCWAECEVIPSAVLGGDVAGFLSAKEVVS
ncbi:MAG: radical SAM protein [Fibrobacteres bacterium]|nr:radical SAM protein [Fibrobacterota bacterium]